MKSRSWQRVLRAALAIALFGFSTAASAASYSVSYNPYGTVDWGSTLRCQSEHHDHAYSASRITALSNAGYCAVTFMTYSGDYQRQPLDAWLAAGLPNPDPGSPTGWGGGYRRWPPEDYGAPALPLNSLRFYLPGAEEIGLKADGSHTNHMYALGLTTYMEGVGCSSCGYFQGAVHNDNPFGLLPGQIYGSDSEFVTKATALGAIITLNHPVGLPDRLDAINPYPAAIEIYDNYHTTNDEGTCGTNYAPQFIAAWDHVLQAKSPRIWGVASNDWNSAWTPLGTPSVPCWPQITERNRDRGKLQVLLPSYDLGAYMAAFQAGAFFAVVEDNAIKAAFPTVTNIQVTYNKIGITTANQSETITWIGNGTVIGTGSELQLTTLPSDLIYARAEINDGDGRTVYTQPFTLGPPIPPPPDSPIPTLPAAGLAILALALLATVILNSPRFSPLG